MRRVDITYRGLHATIGLKLEQECITGSIKDRTAVGLLSWLHHERPIVPGTVVIESTSGNLGIAMARIVHELGGTFVAVIDLKTPTCTRQALLDGGSEVIVVNELDGRGGYLLRRLDIVRRLCVEHPDYRWANQYDNEANPDMHMRTTGPEILKQAGDSLHTVYVPVSTGGTLAGISAYLRSVRPNVSIVAVDAAGSVALGGMAGRRLIPGIGSSRPSSFLGPDSYHRAVHVEDVETIALCRLIQEDLGLLVGGSSGCTVAALVSDLKDGRSSGFSVCLTADGGAKYLDTFYSDDWLSANGLQEDVNQAIKRLLYDELTFAWRA